MRHPPSEAGVLLGEVETLASRTNAERHEDWPKPPFAAVSATIGAAAAFALEPELRWALPAIDRRNRERRWSAPWP
jgi:hypothetical protein